MQIGTADESGTLNISFTGVGYFTNSGKLIVSENGTLSISNTEKPYSPVGKLGNADIYGTIEISGGSFWSGTLINVYGNASLSGSFSMGYGAVMNVNTSSADFTGSRQVHDKPAKFKCRKRNFHDGEHKADLLE